MACTVVTIKETNMQVQKHHKNENTKLGKRHNMTSLMYKFSETLANEHVLLS